MIPKYSKDTIKSLVALFSQPKISFSISFVGFAFVCFCKVVCVPGELFLIHLLPKIRFLGQRGTLVFAYH